jgi:hypothetical protein
VSELRRRLKAERGVRKACERWLRAELRTREEMEALLLAIRDTAFGRPAGGRDDEGVSALSRCLDHWLETGGVGLRSQNESLKTPTCCRSLSRSSLSAQARGVEVLLESLRSTSAAAARPAGRSSTAAAATAAASAAAAGGPRRRGSGSGEGGFEDAAAPRGGRPVAAASPAASAAARRADGGPGGTPHADAARREFEQLKRRLGGDGARLKEQVSTAKALLRERLLSVGQRG